MNVSAPPTQTTTLLTGEDLLAMGDIGRSELVEGRLIPLSPTKPRHGKYEYQLGKVLGEFVDEHDLGEVQVGDVGIYTRRNPDTVRGADVLFISHERLARATPEKFLDVAPELVIKIMSPDDRWSEVRKKLREYFAVGVVVVLVVDPEEQVIQAYRSPTDVHEYTGADLLTVEDILLGFSLQVADLFAD